MVTEHLYRASSRLLLNGALSALTYVMLNVIVNKYVQMINCIVFSFIDSTIIDDRKQQINILVK